jgi:hypothetical protein
MLTGDPVGLGASIVSVFTSKQPLLFPRTQWRALIVSGNRYFLLAPDLSNVALLVAHVV